MSDSDKKSYPAIFDTWGDFFIQGNVVDDGQINGAADYDRCMKATKDNWEYGVYNQFDKKYGTLDEGTKKALRRTTPVETGTVTTHDARTAFERVMDYAGCSLHRDRVDERIVQETRTGTANYQGMNEHNGQGVVEGIDWKSVGYPKKGIIDSQDDVIPVGESSAWPELVQGVILKDSDNDGMPDEWEKKYGLNPNDASDRNGKTVDEEGTPKNIVGSVIGISSLIGFIPDTFYTSLCGKWLEADPVGGYKKIFLSCILAMVIGLVCAFISDRRIVKFRAANNKEA